MDRQITFLATLIMALVARLFGAGISAHFEVADQIHKYLNITHTDLALLLKKYPDEFRVGSIYPDWGYLWESSRKAAEASHWKPYHNKALCYIFETYGPRNEWDVHAEKLFVFICGLSCHGTVDDLWHFGQSSFIKQAEKNDNQNEFIIESLGDLLIQEERRKGEESYNWWIPVADMIAISTKNNTPVTYNDIILGMTIQQLALFIEEYAANIAYWPARFMLPWTHKNYWTWNDGGLEHGSKESALVLENFWNRFLSIEDGEDLCFLKDYLIDNHEGHSHKNQVSIPPKQSLAIKLFNSDLLKIDSSSDRYGAVVLKPPSSKYYQKVKELINSVRSFENSPFHIYEKLLGK